MAQTPTGLSQYTLRPLRAARAIIASGGFLFAIASPALAQDQPPATTAVSLNALQDDRITEELLDRLEAWTRLHGYIQFFHPSEWAWTTNMFEVARDGYTSVAGATDPATLAQALQRAAAPVGPSVQAWPADATPPEKPDMRRGASREGVPAVIGWRHDGYTSTMQMRGPMFSRRIAVNATGREAIGYGFAPDNPYERTLAGGVRVRVPHALWVDKYGAVLPDPVPRTRLRRDWPNEWTYADASERLAAIGYAWNLAQHFHPSIDREEIGWDVEQKRRWSNQAANIGPQNIQPAANDRGSNTQANRHERHTKRNRSPMDTNL